MPSEQSIRPAPTIRCLRSASAYSLLQDLARIDTLKDCGHCPRIAVIDTGYLLGRFATIGLGERDRVIARRDHDPDRRLLIHIDLYFAVRRSHALHGSPR